MAAFDLKDGPLARVDWRLAVHEGLPAAALAVLLCLFALVISVVMRNEVRPGVPLPLASAAVDAPLGEIDTRLRLPGGTRTHAAQDLRLQLPAEARGAARWVVWIARDPVDAVWLQGTGWRSQTLDFFRPLESEGLVPSAFLFPLDAHARSGDVVALHAVGTMPVALEARLVSEDAAARWMQRSIALNVIVYTGTFVLALIAVALFWILREAFFLVLFGAALASALLFAASNGHLYALPGLHVLGLLRGQGIWALSAASSGGVLALAQHVSDPRAWPRLVRFSRATCIGLLALAALLFLGLEAVSPWARYLAYAGATAAGVAGLLSLGSALRGRAAMVLPAAALLALTSLAGLARAALSAGLVADTPWTRYGYQVALLCLLVVLAMALIVPIGSYRQQRDRERDARVDSERRMELEAARAGLARVLQSRLRELSPMDVEWTAFRLMLEHLLPHLRADGAAVVARGYHGRDIVVTDPIEDRKLTDGLDPARLAQVKRLAVSGRASQHAPQVGGRRRNEAVVPIGIPLPGWGALLLHRDDDAGFSDADLALAHEFVRLTVLHADEAVVTHALKRTAELDALTGTFNRRSIDQWLARHFAQGRAQALSLLFVDIDHFKQVNDIYGHACGDHCLRQVALALRAGLRGDAVLGRYGGEEFVVLLPGADANTARNTAEALRAAVEACAIEWQGAQQRLTVSIGVATRAPGERSAAAVVERADRALYAAKRGGRNRISVSPATFLG